MRIAHWPCLQFVKRSAGKTPKKGKQSPKEDENENAK